MSPITKPSNYTNYRVIIKRVFSSPFSELLFEVTLELNVK